MWLFSFILIPVLYFIDFFEIQKDRSKSYLHFSIGLLLGIFYSVLIMLLFSPREYTIAKFSAIFLRHWILFILPLLILFALHIFSLKPFIQKTQNAIESFVGFYSIFIPFYVLNYFKNYTFFSLFILPLLFALTLFGLSYSLPRLVSLIQEEAAFLTICIASLFIIVSLIAASLILSFWVIGFSTLVLVLSFLLFSGAMFGLWFLNKTYV